MTSTWIRLTRAGVAVASLALVATACGDQSSSSSSPGETGSGSDDSGAVDTGGGGGQDGAGAYEGLCAWTTPEAVEAVFGEPVDALGGKECRFLPADESGSDGFYHVRLEQAVPFDEQVQRLADNQKSMGFTICDQESTRSNGMRVDRSVICPTGGGEIDDFEPVVTIEVGPGRVLTNQPFPTATEQEAQEASKRFVEIMESLAETGKGDPLINEVLLGKWLEVYNPTDAPLDLSGFTLAGSDDVEESVTPGSIDRPDGAKVPAGGRLVVDISGLDGLEGDDPVIQLVDPDGRMADTAYLNYAKGKEVVRRDGDGGPYCSFTSTQVTRDAPNPTGCD